MQKWKIKTGLYEIDFNRISIAYSCLLNRWCFQLQTYDLVRIQGTSVIMADCEAISLIQGNQRLRVASGLSVSSKEISDHTLLQGYQSHPRKSVIMAFCRTISLRKGNQRL
ncbi:hypothetical protein PoB_007526800 [Plakobranchus ocellatus]|uniref:Uncharacterized protein n=1 Tax=Plakobranchus ocellatus TaxID=259542 RepID=A0AAV4DWK3_9GAST|nr:hypothetical protein PoB_007526800 [Plakobranchus ocellatus]